MARGVQITPVEVEAFIAQYMLDFNFSRAAEAIGRGNAVMHKFFDREKWARELLEEAKAVRRDNLEAKLYQIAMSPLGDSSSVAALVKLLQKLDPEYRDKSTVDVTNSDGSLQGLTDIQIAARVAALMTIAENAPPVIDAEVVELPAPQRKLEDLL